MPNDAIQDRADLSPYIVHLTRGAGDQALRNLTSILSGNRIWAKNAFGLAQARDLAERFKGTAFSQSQQTVCFTETPLAYVRHMCGPIRSRQKPLRDYGVVFRRNDARSMGLNPVWYLDTSWGSPGRKSHQWLTHPFRALFEAAVGEATPVGATTPDPVKLAQQWIFMLTPFVETMGTTKDGRPKEFWWEREWRKVGDLRFERNAVVAVVLPEKDHERLYAKLRLVSGYKHLGYVDANWDDERIEAALAATGSLPLTRRRAG